MTDYDPKEIEKKWQKRWSEGKLYLTPDEVKGKDNEYALVEFAYPSGNLHVGHWYAFSVPDIYARLRRMQGKNVMYPMGFDAFGLPAENAAIKNKINPREWTFQNIDYMRSQLQSMGASFDWSREVVTASPDYYKWTQWLFLKFLENNLAYQSETPVNWCPSCKTVLANEQVVAGHCERCDTEVERRNMLQWNLKITDYANRLIDDLDSLGWPHSIKEAQKNWIGRSEGAEISFKVKSGKLESDVRVFTTRPDTIFGATYLVLAPEHPFVQEQITNPKSQIPNKSEIEKYLNDTKKKTDIERSSESKGKTGVELKGVIAINPATKEEIPVWTADYVLPHYGTGAIMAVPAHDERDWEFAKKFDLEIRQVVAPIFLGEDHPPKEGVEDTIRHGVIILVKHWSEDKYLLDYSPQFQWKCLLTGGVDEGEDPLETARREVVEETGYKNIKTARYIPLEHVDRFHAAHKGVNRTAYQKNIFIELTDGEMTEVSEEEKELHQPTWLTEEEMRQQISLPNHLFVFNTELAGGVPVVGSGMLVNSGKFSSKHSSEVADEIIKFIDGEKKTTYKLRDWVVSRQRYWGCPIPVIHCDNCGMVPVPEKDLPVVLPEVSDYLPSDDGQSPLSKATDWVKVKCPKCDAEARRETDTLDTFIDSSWYFLRYADPKNEKEFASKKLLKQWLPVSFYSGGAEHTTMHLLYSRFFHKVLFDLGLVNETEPYLKRMNRSLIMGPDGQKMSKSRGNVIDPDKEVERLGADTIRIYLAFIGPYNEVNSYPWNPDATVGVRRFLERVWRLKEKVTNQHNSDRLTRSFATGSDTDQNYVGISTLMHQTIKKVTEDIESMKMNTAVSSLMILVNSLEKEKTISRDDYETLLKLLAPFAPHMTEELWETLGHKDSIHTQVWPTYDPDKLVSDEATLAVQINGKIRATLVVSISTPEEEIRAKTLALPEVEKWLDGAEPKKVIVIPGKIVSIVV